MDLASQSCLNPRMRAALLQQHEEEIGTYKTSRDIVLETTADLEPWQASDFVLEKVPNFNEIKIHLIDSAKISFNDIHRDLRATNGPIGLILLGSISNRKEKPDLIVMTTERNIYAFDPNYDGSISFLKAKLSDPSLQFWTTNGLKESECLFHNYQIDLTKVKAKTRCCTGMHLHLIDKMANLPNAAQMMYPLMAVLECRRNRLRIEKFEILVEIWLDINKSEIYFEKTKLTHLQSRPLNLTAQNIIKKRCILVRSLAKALDRARWLDVRTMCKNTFSRLLDCSKEAEEQILKEMKRCQQNKELDIGYVLHLDSGDRH